MTSYYENRELLAYEEQLAAHSEALATWQASIDALDQMQASAMAAWEQTPEPRDPAPVRPPDPPQPPAPATPTTYTTRLVEAPEQLDTAYGPALVLPGRLVATGSNGASFSLSEEELAVGYTDTAQRE